MKPRDYFIIAIIILLTIISASLFQRYSIVGAGTGMAYRIDKLTGKVAFCTPSFVREVKVEKKSKEKASSFMPVTLPVEN
jgi:hypothetical protein